MHRDRQNKPWIYCTKYYLLVNLEPNFAAWITNAPNARTLMLAEAKAYYHSLAGFAVREGRRSAVAPKLTVGFPGKYATPNVMPTRTYLYRTY